MPVCPYCERVMTERVGEVCSLDCYVGWLYAHRGGPFIALDPDEAPILDLEDQPFYDPRVR